MHLTRSDILKLSVAQRLELVEDIWDSIAEMPGAIELSAEERSRLDSRLEAFGRDASAGSPWSEVRRRISNKK